MGSTYLGTDISQKETFRFLDYYYQNGGRTIDTARVYGQDNPKGVSKSEEVIGAWIKAKNNRHDLTIITKGGHPPLDDFSVSRLSSEEIMADIDDSLACLGIDAIDIYFLHRDNKSASIPEIMDTLNNAVSLGKIRSFGASNWEIPRIMEANSYAATNGLIPFSITELQWSLAVCTGETWGDDTLVFMTDENYKALFEMKMPVLAYASQAKGLFSQYIEQGPDFVKEKAKRFLCEKNITRIEKVREISDKYKISPAQVVLSYINDNSLKAAAIIGCSSINQLDDSMKSDYFHLSANEVEYLFSD